MATKYIDLNCANAVERNQTNNRWKVKVDDLNIPAGSTIQVQNSLINKQGITGQSIEFNEDFSETILFNYYSVDTSYLVPATEVGDPTKITDYNVLVDTRATFNPDKINPADDLGVINSDYFGHTENILPLAGVIKAQLDEYDPTLAQHFLVPLVGKANIKVPKGIYTVTSLGQLITDQINRIKNPENTQESGYEERRRNNTNRGTVSNNTTLRFVQTLPQGWQENLGGDEPIVNPLWNSNGPPPGGQPDTRLVQANLDMMNNLPRFGALEVSDDTVPAVVAIKPFHMTDLFFVAKNALYGTNAAGTPLDPTDTSKFEKVFGPIPPGDANVANPRFGMIFETNAGTGTFDQATQYQNYDLFQLGTQVGTTSLKLDYDGDRSGYRFQHLHEPKRIPSHDKRGNALSNPGQECVFLKRLPNYYAQGKTQYDGNSQYADVWNKTYPYHIPSSSPAADYTQEQVRRIQNALESYMMRTSGILVFNWAYETALEQRDVPNPITPDNTKAPTLHTDDFRTFRDFFSNDKLAKTAWSTTMWSRLGFSYEQMADPTKYTSQNFFGTNESLTGVTTGAKVDTSLAPFVSTLYNSYGKVGGTKGPTGDQFRELPDLPDAQVFSLSDVSIANVSFNNNVNKVLQAAATGPPVIPEVKQQGAVASYEGSEYDFCTMIPVQTTGDELLADNLPVLSTDGYMLVLSDIINQDDEAGKSSELGILDMIPKSSLSNQDFIADRNFITHKLSNPKSVNYVNVNVVNPDLTDVSLQPNSTILLKITKPADKPTVMLADADVQIAEQGVLQNVDQQVKKASKEGLL